MNSRLRITVAAAAGVLAISPARAVDLTDWLKISGFGTLGVAKTSSLNGVEYAGGVDVPGGIKDNWSSRLDTKLGLQAEASLAQNLTGTVQILSKYRYDGSYMPTTQWANLKYAFTPDASLRVGRFGAPAFMISDSLNVGYAQPWLRPPLDAYRRMPINSIDGVEGSFRFHWGDSTFTVQPGVGTSESYLVSVGSVVPLDLKRMYSLNLSFENGPFTVRYGRVHADVKPASTTIGDFDDDFNGLGLIYDQGNWLVQTEYVWRTTSENKSAVPPLVTAHPFDGHSAYATVGYRFGSVMPYATRSNYRDQGSFPINMSSDQDTVSLGARWDFARNMDFKVQFDRVTPHNGVGLFYRTMPSPITSNNTPRTISGSVNVLSFAIDFVF